MSLAQALALRPRPVAPARIGDLARAWIGQPPHLLDCCGADTTQVRGVRLFYGKLDCAGQPDFGSPYASVTEFPERNAVVDAVGITYFPGGGDAILDGRGIAGPHSATLRAHGLYVVIRASDDAHALAAAGGLRSRSSRAG